MPLPDDAKQQILDFIESKAKSKSKFYFNDFTKIFPGLRGIGFSHCWTGLIAATRDAQAHSGAHEGIWYSVGASGLVSCADAGRRMAQRILNADVGGSGHFPRWPLRDSEALLWRGFGAASALRDRLGSSRLR